MLSSGGRVRRATVRRRRAARTASAGCRSTGCGAARPLTELAGDETGQTGLAVVLTQVQTEGTAMSGLEWFLSATLFVLYIVLLFTVCMLTFKKGHTLLGILGIFFPFLWLIGAILPAKRGSRFDVEQATRYQQNMADMTR
jgi:hypothetical protein